MKSPIAVGLLAFSVTYILMALALPVSLSYFFGASSSLCLDPTPANQIKSIQIFPEIKHRLFSHFLSRNGNPSVIKVHINPYYGPDKVPILRIDPRTKQMAVSDDCDCQTNNEESLVPFSQESISQILTTYQAPHSPQQGVVDATEVYEVLKTVSGNDIRDYKTLSEVPLKHYKFAYIFPEKTIPDRVTCILPALGVGLGFARRRRETGK